MEMYRQRFTRPNTNLKFQKFRGSSEILRQVGREMKLMRSSVNKLT
jgi:hypothetical protein